ncbi:hypothetical protein ACFW6S_26685 [Streptomyces sp. NPDC058740]
MINYCACLLVAPSAAAVAAPLAGSFDRTVHRRLRNALGVRPLP